MRRKAFRITFTDTYNKETVIEKPFKSMVDARKFTNELLDQLVDGFGINHYDTDIEEFDPPIIDFRKYTPVEILDQLDAMGDNQLVQGILWDGSYDDIITAGKSKFAMKLIALIKS